MKRLLVCLILFSLCGCLPQSSGKSTVTPSSQSTASLAQCPEKPTGALSNQDVKAIALTSSNTQNSGMVKSGKSVGFSFNAQKDW
jgi:hypothetical protein